MNADQRLAVVEFVLWVLAASAAIVAVVLPLGLVIGGDLVAAKFALFLVGFLLFGAGSIAIQPAGPNLEGSIYDSDERRGSNGSDRSSSGLLPGPPLFGGSGSTQPTEDVGITGGGDTDRQHALEARLQGIGPLAGRHLPYEKRIGRGYKVFVTGIVVLAVSFLMEVGGVRI